MTGVRIKQIDGVARRNRRIDWFRILADLERIGMSNRQVAQAIEVPMSVLHRWKMEETEPRFSEGWALLQLHVKRLQVNLPNSANDRAHTLAHVAAFAEVQTSEGPYFGPAAGAQKV